MMGLADLRKAIQGAAPWDHQEADMQLQMLSFLDNHVDCLLRTQLSGHFTASAWVMDPGSQRVLLIHHRKLNRWLQPGGHADGEADLLAVAQREVWEETGLKTKPLSMDVFDLDIHEIPARGQEPAHLHYDVRFLLQPEDGTSLSLNDEVKAAEWMHMEAITELCSDRSVLRMVEKTIGQMRQILDLGAM